jgi:hypothetical protein
MSNYEAWWNALSLPLKIYWAIAIPFTVFFLLQLVFSFVGGEVPDDSPDVDAEIDGDSGIPFQFLTLKNLVAFFTIFGWTGIACIDSGLGTIVSVVVSFAAGLIMMLLMASLFYYLSKANTNGTMKFSKAKGAVGEVYLTIPARRNSIGKVQVKVQGALRTLEAMTDDDDDIPTGKIITVKEVIQENILLVTAK